MLDITDVRTHSETTVRVHLTGAPDHAHRYSSDGRRFLPQYARVRYTYHEGMQVWLATIISIGGPRILKPGPDGAQRLGKEDCKYEWFTVGMDDLQLSKRDPLPEWLSRLVDEIRPSGAIELPGI